MARESLEQQQVCAVPYRLNDERMEFCLVATETNSRWEFPHTELESDASALEAACRCAREQTGLVCKPAQQEPLDDVLATQDRQLVRLIAFLVETGSATKKEADRRIRWCLPEEARARIRRKPMRRLIDLALRRKPS
jgi:8-oxo-dGTP pyrophosphatase MutT (NUDIX family)